MRRLPRRIGIVVALGAAALLVAACGSSSSSSSGGSTTSAVNIAASSKPCTYTFALITHGDNGSFWSVVYKGAKDAAADLGCKLSEVYGSQQQGQAQPDDNAENAQISDAINAHVNGLAVSDHDPALMNGTLAKASAAGIPVVLLNAGCDNKDIAATGALTCVGQPEQLAGQAAGLTFSKLGATNVLCVIHQSGQNLLDRCNGIAQALGVGSLCKSGSAPSKGPACTELTLSTPNAASNPQQAIGQVTSYLQAHPQVNAVMSLNNAIGTALVTSNPASKPKIATFDPNSGVEADLKNGSLAFAVDQQQWLQGYLPISFLYLYNKHNGQTVGGGTTVASGPLIVTSQNISKVSAAIAAGED
jgi:simple sugar transport system substrate-binding protein